MDVQINHEGVQFQLAGYWQEWQPMQPGVMLAAGRDLEFFIPSADVIEHGTDLLRANIEGLACSFDLTRYGVATITEDGAFFIFRQDTGRTILRRLPL